jgi:hypothetical protein
MKVISSKWLYWLPFLYVVSCANTEQISKINLALSTTTQILATFTPTKLETPTPYYSPTATSTSTPIILDLELVKLNYGNFFGHGFFTGIIRNNSDLGIVAPNGGSLTFFCTDGSQYTKAILRVPPLAPHTEGAFFEEYRDPGNCQNGKVENVSVQYDTKDLLFEDIEHEIANWNVEIAGPSWIGSLQNRTFLLTVGNTSRYPCMIDYIIAFAFDSKENIIDFDIEKTHESLGFGVPIPPQEKMGYVAGLNVAAFDRAKKIKAYAISRNYYFCVNPDYNDTENDKINGNTPYDFGLYLENVQSGAWVEPHYTFRYHYIFTAKNTDPKYWVHSPRFHVDVYDKSGKLLGVSDGHNSMWIPPHGLGAGIGYTDLYSTGVGSPSDYYIKAFAYVSSRHESEEIKLPEVKDINWKKGPQGIIVSCYLYNIQSYTYKDVGGAFGILYDKNKKIIGGGQGYIYPGETMYPGDSINVELETYTNNQPDTIDIIPIIYL